MADIRPLEFKRPGTPEYVLAKGNLVRVEVTRDADILHPGDELIKLFAGRPVPPLDSVIPPLIALVTAQALDKGGLDGKAMQTEAMATLREKGMGEPGLLSIGNKLTNAAAMAQRDFDASRKFIR